MVKIAPHFYDHPSDLIWLPAYIAFAYWHSFVKLYCALTFWDYSWNGRNLKITPVASVQNLVSHELGSMGPSRPKAPRGITANYSPQTKLRQRSSVFASVREQLKKENVPI